MNKHLELENFDFSHVEEATCTHCNDTTQHEVYEGHTFSEQSVLLICGICGQRSLR